MDLTRDQIEHLIYLVINETEQATNEKELAQLHELERKLVESVSTLTTQ